MGCSIEPGRVWQCNYLQSLKLSAILNYSHLRQRSHAYHVFEKTAKTIAGFGGLVNEKTAKTITHNVQLPAISQTQRHSELLALMRDG
jgi:hypothetical protein